jgi:hypothetical protein
MKSVRSDPVTLKLKIHLTISLSSQLVESKPGCQGYADIGVDVLFSCWSAYIRIVV